MLRNLRTRLAQLGDNVLLAVIGIGLLLFLIFLLQNTGQLNVKFLFFESKIAIIVLILITSLIGFLAGLLVSFVWHRRRARRHAARTSEQPS